MSKKKIKSNKAKQRCVTSPFSNISANRIPQIKENPDQYFEMNPSWSFAKCDSKDCQWSIENCENLWSEVITKLISFESRTWGEIVNDKGHNHWIDCNKLCKKAKDRINEKGWDFDSIFSLRLTGTHRLFGVINSGVFYVIWYDPNHEICPSNKRHT